MVGGRSVDGVGFDATMQQIADRPDKSDGEPVDVVDDSETGAETVENVPFADESETEAPDFDGQSTWDDWERGWSA